MSGPWGIYVHIPFCQARCTYCDFNTVTGMSDDDHLRYTEAVVKELDQEIFLEGELVSIYFGGGTPSLVDPDLLGRIIRHIRGRASWEGPAEITVETNPGTVTLDKLRTFRQAGVNRLSIGAQALQNHHLTALNRVHDVKAIEDTVCLARQAGFENISLDAIYGLPGQTQAEWRETVEGLMALKPQHLSLYALIVESGTPLKRAVDRGEARLPDPDGVADMADWAEARLDGDGLVSYEISNYAHPGYESRHNQLYWQLEPYLAVGAGAHAYRPGRRWWNVRGVRRYMAMVEAGQDPEEGGETLSADEEMREFVWLGLRQRAGVDGGRFRERFGCLPGDVFGSTLSNLEGRGLVAQTRDSLVLTPRGRDLANVVARALVDAQLERFPSA